MSPTRLLAPLLTPWGEALDPDRPLHEHPRPQLVRDRWLCLNGRWDVAFTTSPDEPAEYGGRIVVPFPPEAPLSGVGRVLEPHEWLHYRRGVDVPADWPREGHRVLLHLGAVDQSCRVDVDGRAAGEHAGGVLPFTVDVTELVADDAHDGHVLHVVVRDPTTTGVLSRGKQTLEPGGIWYTPHSGIWQTVWLECVPDVHVTAVRLAPDLAAEVLEVKVEATAPVPCEVVVSAGGAEVARATGTTGQPLRLPLPGARRWTPEDPFLHDLRVSAGDDVVASYAGLRTFGVGPDAQGLPRLLLNGEPYLHVGVLDQGYWPDGLVTPPSDEAMVHDITTMKQLGFTMLRKHIKVEPLRWYHHCDRIGMLVWQDAVNGGGRYRPDIISLPAAVPLRRRDDAYAAFGRQDAAAREHWLEELDATIDLLRDVVSLALWVPFNEGWGQFDAAATAARVAALDPSRPVDHASGWHDQGAGDLTSLHVYVRPFRVPRRRAATAGRVLALTEYGGYSWRVEGHSASAREFGYRRFGSAEALGRAFARLHGRQVEPAVPRGLGATVYTQLADVEDETNGLLTADRRVLKLPAAFVRGVLDRLREGMA